MNEAKSYQPRTLEAAEQNLQHVILQYVKHVIFTIGEDAYALIAREGQPQVSQTSAAHRDIQSAASIPTVYTGGSTLQHQNFPPSKHFEAASLTSVCFLYLSETVSCICRYTMIAKRKGTQSKHLTSKETCYQFYKIICRAFKVAVPSCSIPVQTKMLEWLRSESKRESTVADWCIKQWDGGCFSLT